MYTTNRTLLRKFLAITMAIVMALTVMVSAFASDVRPFYESEVNITGRVFVSSQEYTVTVQATNATQIKMEATLYQKQLLGRKEISNMSASASGNSCVKKQSAAVESGKTYVIEVTAQVYSGGVWDTIEKTLTVKT